MQLLHTSSDGKWKLSLKIPAFNHGDDHHSRSPFLMFYATTEQKYYFMCLGKNSETIGDFYFRGTKIKKTNSQKIL